MRNDSDEALMYRYREGDVRAFELLVTRHRKAIYNFILRSVRDPSQAEDLLQETFLRLIKMVNLYEQQAKFTTWLYTIARNLCIDAARRAMHRKTASLDAQVGDDTGQVALGDFVADGNARADHQALGRELRLRIQRAVESLPDEQREIFLLREVANLQFNEIAKIIGCPENTVKSRMRYALEKLRGALEEYQDLVRAAQ